MGFTVAVVGATGNVGREMLTTLVERDFPADNVVALASSRSIGKEVSFGEDDVLKVQGLDTFDFRGIDIVLSSPGAKVSAGYAPRATKAGAVVIDNTSCFRMEPDVPLVVPEVNPQAIGLYSRLTPAGVLDSTMSMPANASGRIGSTGYCLPAKSMGLPALRSEARNLMPRRANLCSTSTRRMISPTAPVAPTTATLGATEGTLSQEENRKCNASSIKGIGRFDKGNLP